MLLFVSCSAAEGIDLSGLPYDELVKLQRQVTLEVMSRPEWKEVKLPAGQWVVGEDIPAGSYSVTGTADDGVFAVYDRDHHYIVSKFLEAGDVIGKFAVEDGCVFDLSGTVILAPAITLGI